MKKYFSPLHLTSKIIIFTLIALPIFGTTTVNSAEKSYVYVDTKAKNKMDGSYNYPFTKIQDAINLAEKENKNVKIRKGNYRENIYLPEKVEVSGSNYREVVIRAKNSNKPVATMKNDSALKNVTLEKGEVGVYIGKDAGVLIKDCLIRNNDEDGIRAKKGASKKDKLVVVNTKIENNGWTGIFSEKRAVHLENNQVLKNDKDGIDLAEKSKGAVRNNRIKKNDGVGIKVAIDRSDLEIRKNTIRENRKDGIEVKTRGKLGWVKIDKNKLYKNGSYGIARVQKGKFSDKNWNKSLKIINNNTYTSNKRANVSPIFL
ncbi:MAG TPA: right-handed parallel beta-helix repeat-containing protein [Candidatus Moranbacteria bacterium]|nr:right-handed parallel beta-helix repeat-containing protein [Candidatus Moranbacteria bacterium]